MKKYIMKSFVFQVSECATANLTIGSVTLLDDDSVFDETRDQHTISLVEQQGLTLVNQTYLVVSEYH